MQQKCLEALFEKETFRVPEIIFLSRSWGQNISLEENDSATHIDLSKKANFEAATKMLSADISDECKHPIQTLDKKELWIGQPKIGQQ